MEPSGLNLYVKHQLSPMAFRSEGRVVRSKAFRSSRLSSSRRMATHHTSASGHAKASWYDSGALRRSNVCVL